MTALLCPCGDGRDYAACCGRWHAGEPAPSAATLMRSRYSAFVLELESYLLNTWHASTRPVSVGFDPKAKWLGLTVKSFRETDDSHAEVGFVARYRVGGGSAVRLHELSRFVREGSRWYYLDGDSRN